MEWNLSPRATICSAIGAWLLAIFLEKTGMITPDIAWVIVGLSSLLFIPAIIELCGLKKKIAKGKEDLPIPLSHTDSPIRNQFTIEGYTSMKEAATELYEAFPETFILERARQELQMDIRFISNDPIEERLKFAAKFIASKIPIYGEDSLTGVFGRIVHMELIQFNHDLTKLTHALYDKSPNGSYVKIAVKHDEFCAFKEEEGMYFGHRRESINVQTPMVEQKQKELPRESALQLTGPISVEAKTNPANLVLFLTNKSSPTPLTDCRVFIFDLRIWSESLKQFSVVPGFDHTNDMLPMRIYGPAALYADEPVVCYFIESSDKKELRISSLEPLRTVVLQERPGIWCASLSIQVGTKEFPHRICFEWKLGETLRFIQCPDLGIK